jgi:hypothetical protein
MMGAVPGFVTKKKLIKNENFRKVYLEGRKPWDLR